MNTGPSFPERGHPHGIANQRGWTKLRHDGYTGRFPPRPAIKSRKGEPRMIVTNPEEMRSWYNRLPLFVRNDNCPKCGCTEWFIEYVSDYVMYENIDGCGATLLLPRIDARCSDCGWLVKYRPMDAEKGGTT